MTGDKTDMELVDSILENIRPPEGEGYTEEQLWNMVAGPSGKMDEVRNYPQENLD